MEKKKRRFKMPTSYTVLFILIIFLAILTWIIPAGDYDVNEAGQYVAGTYHQVKANQQSLYDVLMAPVIGMVGNEKTSQAIDVALFILVIGGFLGVVNKTGALDAGIANVIKKYEGREKLLIPILMVLFALGGSSYGMAEETMAFYPLLIPVMIGCGFDSLTAIGVILIGSNAGCLASTVNPFATGIASDIAGISLGEGFIWRAIMFVLITGVSIIAVYSYASKIQKDPTKSLVYHNREFDEANFKVKPQIEEMSSKQKVVVWIFMLTFVIMILGLIPWPEFGITIFDKLNEFLVGLPFLGFIFKHTAALGTWYFSEITMLFFAVSILICIVYGLSEEDYISAFMAGACDMIGVALICGISRGIQVVMNEGMITATVLHWGEQGLAGLSEQVFIILTYLFYLPMSFLISGSSSLAGATMPLLAPLGEFVGVGAHLVITAYQSALGVVGLITPTNGIMMGALALANIDLGIWYKYVAKLVVVTIIISMAILVVATFF
ncbi:YfcC family protein [Vaginisenegalia massiliensis]|uniref:YfcC family protein n=1 Tax=Vaginisenegalia massiliensis TaxID=2058294 RepID=UPI000F549E34|nr:YfcC family protein [Vaginisenegalia massiliensis]